MKKKTINTQPPTGDMFSRALLSAANMDGGDIAVFSDTAVKAVSSAIIESQGYKELLISLESVSFELEGITEITDKNIKHVEGLIKRALALPGTLDDNLKGIKGLFNQIHKAVTSQIANFKRSCESATNAAAEMVRSFKTKVLEEANAEAERRCKERQEAAKANNKPHGLPATPWTPPAPPIGVTVNIDTKQVVSPESIYHLMAAIPQVQMVILAKLMNSLPGNMQVEFSKVSREALSNYSGPLKKVDFNESCKFQDSFMNKLAKKLPPGDYPWGKVETVVK